MKRQSAMRNGQLRVLAKRYAEPENGGWINFDDENAIGELIDYLVSFGYRKIAVISGSVDSFPSQERLKGYQKGVMKHNLFFDPSLIKRGLGI